MSRDELSEKIRKGELGELYVRGKRLPVSIFLFKLKRGVSNDVKFIDNAETETCVVTIPSSLTVRQAKQVANIVRTENPDELTLSDSMVPAE